MDLEYVTRHTVVKTHIPKSGNAGGVSLQNFSVAIDSTNSPKTGSVFLHKLEHYFGLPVKYLVITHYHPDHTGCVRPHRKGFSQHVLEDISITLNCSQIPDLEQTNLADRRGRPTVDHWYKFYKSKKL